MKFLAILLVVFLLMGMLGSCGGDADDYAGYSSTYQNSSSYREDVREIADVFGVSEAEVDRKISAVAGD